jgi:hypothetical protein
MPILTEWSLRHLDVYQRRLDFECSTPGRRDWDGGLVTPAGCSPRSPDSGDLLGAQYRQKGNVGVLPGCAQEQRLFG